MITMGCNQQFGLLLIMHCCDDAERASLQDGRGNAAHWNDTGTSTSCLPTKDAEMARSQTYDLHNPYQVGSW
jgi:hypothetical protein